MLADTIFKTEEKPEVDRFTTLIRGASEKQQDTMHLVIKSVNLGIAIGKGEVVCEQMKKEI